MGSSSPAERRGLRGSNPVLLGSKGPGAAQPKGEGCSGKGHQVKCNNLLAQAMSKAAAKDITQDWKGLEDAPLFETFNATGLGTLKYRLERVHTGTKVVFVQEPALLEEGLGDLDAWASKRGWTFLAAPSVKSEAGKAHLGAAIFVRGGIGIRWPAAGKGVVREGRIMKVMLDIPDWPPMAAGCCYMPTGGKVTKEYCDCLGDIGRAFEDETLFIIAAD